MIHLISMSMIKNKIMVMSGKGGVGKSSVAGYLCVGLARKGYDDPDLAFTQAFNKMVEAVVTRSEGAATSGPETAEAKAGP